MLKFRMRVRNLFLLTFKALPLPALLALVSLSSTAFARNPLDLNALSEKFSSAPLLTAADLHDEVPVRLLPKGSFRLLKSGPEGDPLIQNIVDQVFLDLFATPTGAELCSEASVGLRENLEVLFGLSEQAARRAVRLCGKRRAHNARPLDRPRKSFYFVRPDSDEKPKFSSWTYRIGDGKSGNLGTVFNVSKDSLKYEAVYGAFAHELAMMVDCREHTLNHIEPIDLSSLVWRAIQHPQIRMTFSEVRAFTLENLLMKELGFKVNDETWSRLDCEGKFRSLLPSVTELASLRLPSTDDKKIDPSLEFAHESEMNLGTAFLIVKYNEVINPAFLPESRAYSICEALAVPFPFESYFLWPKSDPGPKPRIGDGGGSFTPPPPLDLEKIEGLNIFAEEAKQAARWKSLTDQRILQAVRETLSPEKQAEFDRDLLAIGRGKAD
jgi:hypothetical protein